MKLRLPHDATLRTVFPSVKDAVEYVRAVFANMAGLHRDCQMRLLLDSSPASPDYVVEMLFEDVEDGETVEISQTLAIFRGRGHGGRLLEPQDYDRPRSTAAMRWQEVQQLLGELRGLTPKPRSSHG